eukprot:2264755-Rhodomonas_salina.1
MSSAATWSLKAANALCAWACEICGCVEEEVLSRSMEDIETANCDATLETPTAVEYPVYATEITNSAMNTVRMVGMAEPLRERGRIRGGDSGGEPGARLQGACSGDGPYGVMTGTDSGLAGLPVTGAAVSLGADCAV